jgi:hypothetical protein
MRMLLRIPSPVRLQLCLARVRPHMAGESASLSQAMQANRLGVNSE